jgi:predicted nucleic acid-binding protein
VIVLFDAGFLHILFDDKARIPHDKSGNPVVDRAQERIDFLVQTMSQRRDKIIVPTPALAEFMLLAVDRWNEYLTIIRRKTVFEIVGFNDPEAVELVEHWKKHGDSKRLKQDKPETWAKLKYDRQILAIAVTHRVECIYSTDGDLKRFAVQIKRDCLNLSDLPLPAPTQTAFRLEDPTP